MNKNQIQHGDVLLNRVGTLPKGLKVVPRENGRLILARGEATGHNHAIVDEGCQLMELKGELYLDVTAEQVTITHEEHKPLSIPQGIYKIGRVQEYDYFAEMAKFVRD